MVSDVDDGSFGGSFERLVREAEEASKGNESLKLTLLTQRVLRDLVYRKVEKRAAAAQHPSTSILAFHVPKRNRSGPCSNVIVQEPKKPKANAKAKAKEAAQIVVPEMPERFKNKIKEMGGSKVVLVIQKELKHCDIIQGNNRFSIPSQQIVNNFLEAEEKERVYDRKEKMENVKLIQPCLSEVTEVTLRRWDMKRNYTLNLFTTWYGQVVFNPVNQLHVGSNVQLYAFRRLENNNELCFALVNLDMKNDIST